MLFLAKSLSDVNIREHDSITRVLQIVDELLYYTNEVEKSQTSSMEVYHVFKVLDELDHINSHHMGPLLRNHWMHIRDSPMGRGVDEYREGGKCNFLALAV